MRVRRFIYCWMLLVCFPDLLCARADRHKSESEIVKMTPEQRVQEYCDEYHHHAFWDGDYIEMVNKYVLQDGAKSIPAITQIINEFDPTSSRGKSRQKNARAFAAEGLLSQVDGRVIRLRAIPEGRTAIEAMSRLIERMLAAHFDVAEDKHEYSERLRYEASRDETKRFRGLNFYDRAIQDTLRIQYKTKLSDNELLDFINYLISQEPRYPSWSRLENYKDMTDRNEAGNPRQFLILKNMGPIYNLYLKHKGTS